MLSSMWPVRHCCPAPLRVGRGTGQPDYDAFKRCFPQRQDCVVCMTTGTCVPSWSVSCVVNLVLGRGASLQPVAASISASSAVSVTSHSPCVSLFLAGRCWTLALTRGATPAGVSNVVQGPLWSRGAGSRVSGRRARPFAPCTSSPFPCCSWRNCDRVRVAAERSSAPANATVPLRLTVPLARPLPTCLAVPVNALTTVPLGLGSSTSTSSLARLLPTWVSVGRSWRRA